MSDVLCTWEGCFSKATHRMIAKDGENWASLCDTHKTRFDSAIDAKTVLATWVKAQGGAKRAASRMTGGNND